jgi:uncharacterized protein YcfJ
MNHTPTSLGLRAGLVLAALAPALGHAAQYATVVSSTPVVASVNVPRRVCSEGQQFVQPQASGAGAVIGAIAGGLLGNTVGGGFGRAAATGVGAVAGAAIGNSVEASQYPPASVPVQRCQTVGGYENRTVGYDVVYEYNGQRYSTRMDRDPGARLAIDVRPAYGAAPLDRVGPQAGDYGMPQDDARAPASPVPYDDAQRLYDEPQPMYAPASGYAVQRPAYVYGQPAYVVAPPVYAVPPVSIGIGYGYWGGRRHWH